MQTEPIKSFEQAETLVRNALKGTKYENAILDPCGGGDGAEDIKPLLIEEVGDYCFRAVGFPEGGILFSVVDNDEMWDEYEDLEDAMNAWESLKKAKVA